MTLDKAGALVTPKVTACFPKRLARSDLEGPSVKTFTAMCCMLVLR